MNVNQNIKDATTLLQSTLNEVARGLKSEKSRRRGALVAQRHKLLNMMSSPQLFFSQAGQDRVVDETLNAKTGGVFVDIGGYDGVTGSNTLFFETFRKWSGIVVEPAPTQLRLAKAARSMPCLGYAVAGQAGTSDFLEVTSGYTQMSGFLDSYNPDLLKRVRDNPLHKEVIHTLDMKTLGSILDEEGLREIDFLSLDVEGGEMGILESFPFDRFDVTMWSIENNTQSSDIPTLMRDNGYDLVEFAGVDDIFRKRT